MRDSVKVKVIDGWMGQRDDRFENHPLIKLLARKYNVINVNNLDLSYVEKRVVGR